MKAKNFCNDTNFCLMILTIILLICLFIIICVLIYYLFIKSNEKEKEEVIIDQNIPDLDNKVILINDKFIRYDPGLYTGPQSAPGVIHRGPKLVKVL
jgi:hypothetical protein